MSLSEQVEQLIPHLRRYARAASGDSALADECLCVTVQKIIDDRASFQDLDYSELERAIFKALEPVLIARCGNTFQQLAWRALILTELEGFSIAETAHVLGVESSSVASMLKLPPQSAD